MSIHGDQDSISKVECISANSSFVWLKFNKAWQQLFHATIERGPNLSSLLDSWITEDSQLVLDSSPRALSRPCFSSRRSLTCLINPDRIPCMHFKDLLEGKQGPDGVWRPESETNCVSSLIQLTEVSSSLLTFPVKVVFLVTRFHCKFSNSLCL